MRIDKSEATRISFLLYQNNSPPQWSTISHHATAINIREPFPKSSDSFYCSYTMTNFPVVYIHMCTSGMLTNTLLKAFIAATDTHL